jgi:hypothetical protein
LIDFRSGLSHLDRLLLRNRDLTCGDGRLATGWAEADCPAELIEIDLAEYDLSTTMILKGGLLLPLCGWGGRDLDILIEGARCTAADRHSLGCHLTLLPEVLRQHVGPDAFWRWRAGHRPPKLSLAPTEIGIGPLLTRLISCTSLDR